VGELHFGNTGRRPSRRRLRQEPSLLDFRLNADTISPLPSDLSFAVFRSLVLGLGFDFRTARPVSGTF
jgi:hypothetical protein